MSGSTFRLTLDQLAAQGAELLEAPQWRTFFRGIPFLLMAEHLHFPIEVMPSTAASR